MTDKTYSSLDETSLRNLLDGTVDMVERRLIRTAIRELRRREIEDMEAALTNKRFRRAQENRHEDKENQLRLRGTTEYEERKLIRAAIRRLRDEEIQGALEKIQLTGRHLEQQPRPQISLDLEETQKEGVDKTERIETFHSQTQSKDVLRTGSSSDMVLVLDPLVREKVSCPLTLRAERDSGSPSSEVIPSYRTRSDSGESNRSQDASQRRRLDSGASDRSRVCSRSRSESDTSEQSAPASGWAVGVEQGVGASSLNTDMEAEANSHEPSKTVDPCSTTAAGVDAPDGAVNSKKMLNGTSCTPKDSPFQQKVKCPTPARYFLSFAVFTTKTSPSQPINRASSVRDRVRRFAEPAAISSPTKDVQKNTQGGPFYTKTFGTATATSAHSESQDASTSRPSSCLTTTPGGGGNLGKGLPAQSETLYSVQSLGAVGGLHNSSENVRSASYVLEEEQTPEGKAPTRTPDPQGDPESNMKTFLTIEIKDSRTIAPQASASSSSATTSMMPRLITGSSGQRTELTLGLRPTPFKITSSSLLKGPSIKVLWLNWSPTLESLMILHTFSLGFNTIKSL
ncbi:smoothelin-like [Astyanax mexicanus]|uniref:Smoothelin-like n=1 Tax=Astyanax mexicanus TaxID=7994 RepID=A0A8T2KQ02_ASTMX|nr:smoothelin-like [Astyanax mexicanus]